MNKKLSKLFEKSNNRFEFWSRFINEFELKIITELGVYKGEFAKYILENTNCIEKYFMIDPWRNLSNWNKPANKDNEIFQKFYNETMQATEFVSEKRIVLRGKTTEVIDKIEDNTLDFLYIDGDHTLKGIAIDLMATWDKIKEDGFVGGDDFYNSIW